MGEQHQWWDCWSWNGMTGIITIITLIIMFILQWDNNNNALICI